MFRNCMKDKQTFSHLFINVSVALTLFLIPTNVFYKFLIPEAYVHGILSDYLLPKIYLSDLWIVTSVLVIGWSARKQVVDRLKALKNSSLRYILILILLVIHVLIFSNILTTLLISKFVIFGLYIHLLYIKRYQIIDKYIRFSLAFTMFFQSAVALFQYYFQKSVYGYFFLGEPDLLHYAGIAKQQLFGSEKILPYGTTAHPNVLAGVLVLYFLLLIQWSCKNKQKIILKVIQGLCVVMTLLAIFLTQSLTAWTALILGLSTILCKRYTFLKNSSFSTRIRLVLLAGIVFLAPLSLKIVQPHIPSHESVQRRVYLNSAGWQMFIAHPIFGVGTGSFTKYVEQYSTEREVVRFVQPAHSAGILFLAEWGMAGCLLLFLLVSMVVKKVDSPTRSTLLSWVIVLLPMLSFDHYLYTLQTGQLLFLVSMFLTWTQTLTVTPLSASESGYPSVVVSQ